MDCLKQIMYGVTDFARMRAENGYFIDRTDLIPELEKTSYTVFLRPRRFGKSLFVSILQCYYDVDYAGDSRCGQTAMRVGGVAMMRYASARTRSKRSWSRLATSR